MFKKDNVADLLDLHLLAQMQLLWQLCDRGPTTEGLKEINLILAKQTISWRTNRKECGHIKKKIMKQQKRKRSNLC
jgi:hypothetical protein